MNTEQWSVDRQTGIIKHVNGLTVAIQNGEVVEIQSVPTGVSTRDLPRLLKDAVRVAKTAITPT